MTDQLSLSIWLSRAARQNRLRYFEKLLRAFPFSQRPQPQSLVSIHGIDETEPPLLERPLNGPVDISEVIEAFGEYSGDDLAWQFESWWDLWQYDGAWELKPARIAFACYGPEFDNGSAREAAEQEHLRIEFGVDTYFLPQNEIVGSARLVESNVKSLLRLVHELDSLLPVEHRRLETESGQNFAERLQAMLSAVEPEDR